MHSALRTALILSGLALITWGVVEARAQSAYWVNADCLPNSTCTTCVQGSYLDPGPGVWKCWATKCDTLNGMRFKTCTRGNGSHCDETGMQLISCSGCRSWLCGLRDPKTWHCPDCACGPRPPDWGPLPENQWPTCK